MQSKQTINKRGLSKTPAKQQAKSPQKKAIVAQKENAAPAVDTRTPEEIDASYRRNVARFEEAKAKFENAFASKLVEFQRVYGEGIADRITAVAGTVEARNVAQSGLQAGSVRQGGVELRKGERAVICNCGPSAKAHLKGPDCGSA